MGQHDAIVLFIEEKKWLQKWEYVMTTEYSYFECDIEPDELTFPKIAYGGNVITDGCNYVQKKIGEYISLFIKFILYVVVLMIFIFSHPHL